MAYSGTLNLTLSVKDEQVRDVSPPPVIQTYSPQLDDRRRVTLASEDWTEVTLDDDCQFVLLYLGTATEIRLNWENAADDTEGIPLVGATSNGLVAAFPVFEAGSIWLWNGEATSQTIQVFQY